MRFKYRIKTDLEILQCIYAMCATDYPQKGEIFIPINIDDISKRLNSHSELIFGRLYHDLNDKYGYKAKDGVSKSLFWRQKVGSDFINFPLLGSIIANLEQEKSKYVYSLGLSILAVIVSVASLFYKSSC